MLELDEYKYIHKFNNNKQFPQLWLVEIKNLNEIFINSMDLTDLVFILNVLSSNKLSCFYKKNI